MNQIEIEKEVIGSLLANPDLYVSVADLLNNEAFTDNTCRHTFDALQTMYEKDMRVSMLTVNDLLMKAGHNVSVKDFIGSLNAGSAFEEHCMLLKERQLKRMHVDLGMRLTALGSDEKEDAFDTNDTLLSEAERISNSVGIGTEKTNEHYLLEVSRAMELASQAKGITGIRTGYTDLDSLYSGRQRSDLIIRAARPAMGKTSLTLCEALHMALNEQRKCLFFSLEMSGEQLFRKLVSVHTGIEHDKIKRGQLTKNEHDVFNYKTKELKTDNLRIVDDVYTLNGITTKSRKTKMQHGLDIVFIDYLQLINHKVDKGRNKENEVSEVSRALKMLARALDVPVVCLSQLSRDVDKRGGSRIPRLSDLRDSGAIEQDADVVEFIYRPDQYDKDAVNELGESMEGIAYIIVAKHRSGACGDIELYFNAKLTRFENPKGFVADTTSMKPNRSFDDNVF